MSGQTPGIAETGIRKLQFRRGHAPLWLVLVLSLGAGAFFGNRAQAQQMQLPSPMQIPGTGNSSQISPMAAPDATGPGRIFRERRFKALNTQRQKELVADTNKLLKLTAQLNAQVGSGRSDSFTPDQLRMLARIEKLAKSVKEKMSNPVPNPILQSDFPPMVAPDTMP